MPTATSITRPRKPSRVATPVHDPVSPTKIPRAPLNSCDLLISVLECYLSSMIRRNERKERVEAQLRASRRANNVHCPPPEPSVFHALQAPSITPIEYLRRLVRYAFCSRSVFIAAFYYLEKIACIPGADLSVTSLSVHRLVLTAVLVATKVFDDILYDNAHFAKVGGLDVKELNMLELDFLKLLDFKLCISAEEFELFENVLLNSALSTDDGEYSMLPGRLRNLGYEYFAHQVKMAPNSPVSSMDVAFDEE